MSDLAYDEIDRGLVANMWMSMPNNNQQSSKHQSWLTTYSFILQYLFSTFRLTWFSHTNFHYVYDSYDIEASYICTNMYTIISFTCL